MGADADGLQRAVILVVAVMSALFYGAEDAVVCLTIGIHNNDLLELDCTHSMAVFFPRYSVPKN